MARKKEVQYQVLEYLINKAKSRELAERCLPDFKHLMTDKEYVKYEERIKQLQYRPSLVRISI